MFFCCFFLVFFSFNVYFKELECFDLLFLLVRFFQRNN